MKMNEDLNVIRTAFLTAFPKIFTDIPYSFDIFQSALKLSEQNGITFHPEQFTAKMSVEIEARYKAASKLLSNTINTLEKPPIVIEIAAGLSPRSLEFQNVDYREIDFPLIMEQKSQIFRDINRSDSTNNLIGLDLTDTAKLRDIIDQIINQNPDHSLIFLSEGLFWYLTREDIANLSQIIGSALKTAGGCWISTDCPVDAQYIPETAEQYRSVILNSSGKDQKPFHTQAEFVEFFQNAGFSVKTQKLFDLVDQSAIRSAKLFGYSDQEIAAKINSYTDISTLSYN